MYRKIRFSCPTCRGTVLEEVEPHEERHGLFGCDMVRLRFSKDEGEDVITDRFYRCGACNYVLQDAEGHNVESLIEVVEWLGKRHMLLDEHKRCTKCRKAFHDCRCFQPPLAEDGNSRQKRDKKNGFRTQREEAERKGNHVV